MTYYRVCPMSVEEKCHFLKEEIVRHEKGTNIDVNLENTSWNSCVIDFEDKRLRHELADAGKDWGAWSSKGSIKVDGKGVEGDIPINQQKCGDETKKKYTVVRMPIEGVLHESCKIYEVHLHDGGRPSAHLRIRCNNSSLGVLQSVASLIRVSQSAGLSMCRGESDE